MSQLRENLKPGSLEGDRLVQHVQHIVDNNSVNVNIQVDPPSPGDAEGAGSKGGHDSDPPIENENPNEGDKCFDGSNLSSHERSKAVECARKKAQGPHRKRKKSTHNVDGNYLPPYKKNRRFCRQVSVLPSKFLLGGNIRDPLNLASLSDAKISAELNQVTPQSSPLPIQGQVPIFIPKNPFDPLGLTRATPENPRDIVAGVRVNKCRKHRHRKRTGRKRTDSECSIGTELTESYEEEQDESTNNSSNKRKRRISEQGVCLDSDEEEEDDAKSAEPRNRTRSTSEPPVGFGTVASTTEKKIEATKSQAAATGKVFEKKEETTKAQGVNENKQDNNKKIKVDDVPEKTLAAPKKNETDGQSTSSSKEPNLPSSSSSSSRKPSQSDYYPSPSPHYPTLSSEYVPLSSTYAPSPFAFDGDISCDMDYYGSPSFSCYQYTPTHELEPFSPPTRPELMPPFERQMQMFAATRPPPMSLQRAVFQRPFNRKRFRQRADPIVSPVVPQPGSRRRNHGHHHHNNHNDKKKHDANNSKDTATNNTGGTSSAAGGEAEKKYRPKDQIFQFGNYSQYYGYRTPADQSDSRLWVLKKAYFEGKDVLDIGCNTGHVTLSIARDFEPKRVHGIDIDLSLITAARRNIKNYMTRDPENKNVIFPQSLPMIYGALLPPPGSAELTPKPFPYNVSFDHENYVLSSDALLDNVKPEYDVIICLSVTKWIHLNFGDDGLKRFFRRIFLHLRSGGKFVLEPQPWSSYTKKKKLTEKIHQMYKSIAFFPDKFKDFLLKDVGFASMQSLGTPVHNSKGFQRPLLMFIKGDVTSSPSSRSPFLVPVATTSPPTKPAASSSSSKATASSSSCEVFSSSPQYECSSSVGSSSTKKCNIQIEPEDNTEEVSSMPTFSSSREEEQKSEVTSTESPSGDVQLDQDQETAEVVSSSSDEIEATQEKSFMQNPTNEVQTLFLRLVAQTKVLEYYNKSRTIFQSDRR